MCGIRLRVSGGAGGEGWRVQELLERVRGEIGAGGRLSVLGPQPRAGEIVVMDWVRECMDGPRLLRMRLGGLVPHSLGCGIALLGLGVSISPLLALVSVGLRSWGWGLASLPSLHSLALNCTLGVG